MKHTLLAFVAMVMVLASCDPRRIYEENKRIEADFWYVDSLMNFSFDIPDIETAYNIYANFSHRSSYPFHNLYYRYFLTQDSTMLSSDLVNIHLFDPKSGAPYGKGIGDIMDHQRLILEDYAFPSAGKYTLAIQQYMRMDSLSDVLYVGARVERSID